VEKHVGDMSPIASRNFIPLENFSLVEAGRIHLTLSRGSRENKLGPLSRNAGRINLALS
jgi:hypothetical protein